MFQNESDIEVNPPAPRTTAHRIKISLISRRIVRTRVSLCGSTWKTLALHIFKGCLFIVPSSLPVFAVSSWGRWEGDSQRSAFSYNSPLQPTGDAQHWTKNRDVFLVLLQPFQMRALINRVKWSFGRCLPANTHALEEITGPIILSTYQLLDPH